MKFSGRYVGNMWKTSTNQNSNGKWVNLINNGILVSLLLIYQRVVSNSRGWWIKNSLMRNGKKNLNNNLASTSIKSMGNWQIKRNKKIFQERRNNAYCLINASTKLSSNMSMILMISIKMSYLRTNTSNIRNKNSIKPTLMEI